MMTLRKMRKKKELKGDCSGKCFRFLVVSSSYSLSFDFQVEKMFFFSMWREGKWSGDGEGGLGERHCYSTQQVKYFWIRFKCSMESFCSTTYYTINAYHGVSQNNCRNVLQPSLLKHALDKYPFHYFSDDRRSSMIFSLPDISIHYCPSQEKALTVKETAALLNWRDLKLLILSMKLFYANPGNVQT